MFNSSTMMSVAFEMIVEIKTKNVDFTNGKILSLKSCTFYLHFVYAQLTVCTLKAIVKRSKCFHDICRNSFIFSKGLLIQRCTDVIHTFFMPNGIFYVFLSYFFQTVRECYTIRLMILLCCFSF